MKYGVMVVGLVGVMGLAEVASAQGVPRARTGFQMDIRTGYSLPMGKALGAGAGSPGSDLKLSDLASGQVPVILDIGGKVIPELFLGGYLGLGFGGAGGQTKNLCDAAHVSCSAVTVHLGFVIQYHILPAGLVNPWLGYGVGVETMGMSNLGSSNSDSFTLTGFEFARLMGGTDFRVSEVFGLGPFIDLSLAQYSSAKSGGTSVDLSNTTMHEWLTLGIRGVFFP